MTAIDDTDGAASFRGDWKKNMGFRSEFSSGESLPEDVAALMGTFQETGGLHYVDFMAVRHAQQAVERWPLLQAQQSWQEAAMPKARPRLASSRNEEQEPVS